MLKYPPETRFTAQQAYCHDWIQRKNAEHLKAGTAQQLLSNLRTFHVLTLMRKRFV